MNTFDLTLTSPSLKLIEFFAHPATSGYDFALILHIVRFHGMHIGRVVCLRKRMFSKLISRSFTDQTISRPYQNTSGLDQRNSVLLNDPDVRKFDAERVLCGICDRWVNLASESNAESLQKWFQHRSACQKANGFLTPASPSAPYVFPTLFLKKKANFISCVVYLRKFHHFLKLFPITSSPSPHHTLLQRHLPQITLHRQIQDALMGTVYLRLLRPRPIFSRL